MRFGDWNWSRLGLQFSPPAMSPWMWSLLIGVPVGIIILYFLKLRRKPVQVPSTLLWRRSIEDLHVNSLFQRLRRNLLLFLQLLAVLLVILALLGPQVRGSARLGQRHILAIDNSASMSATDVSPNRLERAKKEAQEIVEGMGPDDLAMVIAFAENARVVSTYTGNKRQLLDRINSIPPSQSTTSLLEALQVASGLANPQRQFLEGDIAADVEPPRLTIFTDGGFPDVQGFSLGNLEPQVVVIGPPQAPGDAVRTRQAGRGESDSPPSDNVAILALQTARNEERPDQFQVFGRVRNYRNEPVQTRARLFRHHLDGRPGERTLIDALELSIEPRGSRPFAFDLPDTGTATLEVQLDVEDALLLDNSAFATIGEPGVAQVLIVTAGNRYLLNTLKTATAAEIAEVAQVSPEDYSGSDLQRDIASGRYDLVIYDNFRPEAPPTANALYFGALPPGEAYEEAREVEGPILLDWDITHPLIQYIRDLSQVRILKAMVVEPPPGSARLIESNRGVLAFVAPREGYSDAVVAFSVPFSAEDRSFNTDWHTKYSYPLFLFNSLYALGNVRDGSGEEVYRPGRPITLRAEPTVRRLEVIPPPGGGRVQTLERTSRGTFVFNGAESLGIYRVRIDGEVKDAFAVNLFDPRESDLAPRGLAPDGVSQAEAEAYGIKIGYTPVAGTRNLVPARQDWWWPIAMGALGIILLEWYIYNRRVYI
ncbi:BatA and WFA domain-containing protein [soil metagenome]